MTVIVMYVTLSEDATFVGSLVAVTLLKEASANRAIQICKRLSKFFRKVNLSCDFHNKILNSPFPAVIQCSSMFKKYKKYDTTGSIKDPTLWWLRDFASLEVTKSCSYESIG